MDTMNSNDAMQDLPAIRWGLIGASDIAQRRVIPAIRDAGGVVAAVHARDLARGAAYAAANGIPQAAPSIDALLAEVDAVYVSTSNERHCEAVLAAAEAGRHVLCEKPLSLSHDDTRRMIAACRAAGVVLATNHHLRSSAVLRAMKAMIGDGRIGRPLFARIANAGYLRVELHGWRLNSPEAGAGVTLDKLVHDVDTLRFILDDEPVAVSATTQNSGMAAGPVEDGVMGTIRFRSGMLAQFHDCFSVPGGATGLEILGTEGALLASNCLTGDPVGELQWRTAEATTSVPLEHAALYPRVIEAFHAAVRGGARPDATGEDGQAAVAVALAALQSAREGREISI